MLLRKTQKTKMTIQSLFLLLLYLFAFSDAQISPGSSLSASDLNQNWTSPNSTFSLAFYQVSPSSFLAGILYAGGIPIWTAGGPSVTVDSGASFRFTPNGTLQLLNGSGTVLWDSKTANLGVTSASLDDYGNFVLRNATAAIWSTFAHPTDTIVPNQNFTVDQVLTSGNYSFHFLRSGNLILRWNNSAVYWNQGLNSTTASNLTSPTLGLQSVGILSISDATLSSAYIVAYSNDYAEGSGILRFLKLDDDGNLRIYSSVLSSGTKTMRWAALDQCLVFGYCGNMGICSYNETDANPVCGCPSQNFEPVDVNDGRKGCKRKVEIDNCTGSATMLQLDHSMFLTYQPELSSEVFFVGISACRLNCLVSGSCAASTSLSNGSGLCYLKTQDFFSGYQSPSLPSTSFVKVCAPALPNSSPDMQNVRRSKDWSLRVWVVCVVVVVTLVSLLAVESGLWWWCCRNSPKFGSLSAQYALLEYASGAPVQFSYKELQRSTKRFKEKLGAGGFGAVYKGVLANRTVVAVKQLQGIEQGEKQFRMEVATISSTHHLNLVRLIGFCSEGRHRLLVYEFMKNGSLDNFLFTEGHQTEKLLDWASRFTIALGTARGITYLHEECRDCIVHCDIKPENILLDENFTAKVSDFGLAKLINPKDHRYRTLTSIRGTRGYLPPEWLANLPITSKSDVYSYGMVLLEIVSGKRNFEVSEETNRKKFSIWAYEEFEKGNSMSILDKTLSCNDLDTDQVIRAIKVSFWCIQEQPSQRPTMGKVVQMLEGVTEIERPPAPTALTEGSAIGTSINLSSNISTFIASPSAPTSSSTSSLQVMGVSPLAPDRNTMTASSSLLHSDYS